MQPRGLLMIEHRLIEKMISHIRKVTERIRASKHVDSLHIDAVVDFIRVYADRTHHGKEEDILFKTLENRSLSQADDRIMKELINEHMFARGATGNIVEANDQLRDGDHSALDEIVYNLDILVDLYPGHIEKEDKIFFPASRKYFSDDEEKAMLNEFWEFDRKLIHEKYTSFLNSMERYL